MVVHLGSNILECPAEGVRDLVGITVSAEVGWDVALIGEFLYVTALRFERPCETEVCNDQVAVTADEDIGRLQVTVNDPHLVQSLDTQY